MKSSKHLRAIAGILALAVMAAVPVEASRKSDKLYKQGQKAEAAKDYDKAVELYEQAVAASSGGDQNPANVEYLIAVRRTRMLAGQKHVDEGQKLRTAGKLDEALKQFQKATLMDPSSPIAIEEARQTADMIVAEKTGPPKPPAQRGETPAEVARRQSEELINSMLPPPELKPITRQISSLKMNNQPPKVLYETVAKLAGINVLFDSQYSSQGRNYNVDLSNSSLEQALDYLAVLTRTFWKPISSNTIFVAEDNVTKRRDYEDEVVRVFYIQNATSVQEFQEMATAIRSVIEIRRVFTYNAQRALVLRGTVDQVALAEKLIRDLDKPKSEVVVDVIVLEANSAKTRNLAATLMQASGSPGLSLPVAFNPRTSVTIPGGTSPSSTPGTTTTTTSGYIPLANLGHISSADFATTLPGALLNAIMSDTTTKVLQSPEIRTSDGMKAELKIGDRIPFATGSYQPGIGTVGVSALVSTQFNFVDTGVNLSVTPQVHGPNEVTLHVELDISQVTQRIDLGGVSEPIIGQRKNTADIRLQDGEVSLLGGLTNNQDSRTFGGIPGLVNIPLLGRIFSSESTEKDRREVLIAIVPHIVRTPTYSMADLRGVYAGTDQLIKVNYAPREETAPAAATGPAPEAARLAPAAPAAPPQPPPPPAAQPAAQPAAPPAGVSLAFVPNVVQAQAGGTITVGLQIQNVSDLFSAIPLRIKYDPSQLRLNDMVAGPMFTGNGQHVTQVKDIRNDTGEATLTVSRLPGSSAVSGMGIIATMSFTAIGKGTSSLSITELGLKSSQLHPILAPSPVLKVTIQ